MPVKPNNSSKLNDFSGSKSTQSYRSKSSKKTQILKQNQQSLTIRKDNNYELLDPASLNFALPSEYNQAQAKNLADDPHTNQTTTAIVPKGSKIGLEYQIQHMDKEEISYSHLIHGRKGKKQWDPGIAVLRKRFGFSWQRMGRRFGVVALLLGVFLIIGISSVATVVIQYWNNTPSIDDIERTPAESSIVLARDGKTEIFEFFQEEKREVINDIDEIPKSMQLAIIALEEESFYNNEQGIPWRNIVGASITCFSSGGDNCRGASGISQQLIKNITGEDDRTIERKIQELFIAIKLNQEKNQDDILRSYANWVPFGRNTYGVQEASKAYFGRPINSRDESGNFLLSPAEACYLASMVQRPGYFEPGISSLPEANLEKQKEEIPESLTKEESRLNEEGITEKIIPQPAIELESRKDACLIKLRELELPIDNQGTIGNFIPTDEELDKWINKPVQITNSLENASLARSEGKVAFVNIPQDDPYPHFREYLTQELTNKIIPESSLYRDGYTITTTIDPDIQRETEKIIAESEDIIKQYGADNASAVVLDGPTGEILAMVGSLGYDREDIDGKVNIATSPQQPGSSIKPYIYAAAFENGFNPSTVIADTPTTWNGYTPKNFDGTFNGPVTMRRALQGSLNIPAVKTLFLTTDTPGEDVKLDTFFNYAESKGLRFPCVDGASNLRFKNKTEGVERCKADEEARISQTDVDQAYRGRCFLASALGGCEVTAVSHATGMNTFFQEGNLRTATPFLTINRKRDNQDIYSLAQNSQKPPYPKNDATEDEKLVARQILNVMTDNDSRIPEFGSTRFNLMMSNPAWKPAAKTGTSNGPRDFWTVGGTPYYTVVLWVGKTDNGTLSPSASSSRAAAPIWKAIMDKLHEGKEVKNFNTTEGLIRTFVSTSGYRAEEGEQPTGRIEWLTPKQTEQRYLKSGRVALNSEEDINKFLQSDIFDLRTTLVPASYVINKVDAKLFVEGKTLEENKEEVECTIFVSEFPQLSNWQSSVNAIVANSESYCKLPEPSEEDQFKLIDEEPNWTINLTSNSSLSLNEIIATAEVNQDLGRSIVAMQLAFDGVVVANSGNGQLEVPISDLNIIYGKNYEISVTATDNFGKLFSKNFSKVSFVQSKPLTLTDITNLKCTPDTIFSANPLPITCNFSIVDGKIFNQISFRIDNSSSQVCTVSGNSGQCNNLSYPTKPGIYNLEIKIDGASWQKSSTTISIS